MIHPYIDRPFTYWKEQNGFYILTRNDVLGTLCTERSYRVEHMTKFCKANTYFKYILCSSMDRKKSRC